MAQSPKMKNSTPRLSEIARHVHVPTGAVTTGWPAVRDRCKSFGIGFDAWQDGIGKIALAKRADGQYAGSVGGVVLSIPRQTGKTYLIGWMVFALCTIFGGMTVIWTAHRTRTSDETFEKMKTMSRRAKVCPHVKNVRSANGQQEIEFVNGSRILFGAREQGFGRGFDEIDVLIFDEAQILTENAMSDMVPATNAAKNGLVLLLGTPPRPGKDPGEVFENRRKDALDNDPDTAYVEFSADKNAKIIDWEQLAKANPSFPHRTSKTAILRMQKLLGSDESFYREAYGIWDETGAVAKAIDFESWRKLEAPKPNIGTHKCFAVKFTADDSTVALAVAVRSADGVHVEALRQANAGEGMRWLVDFLVKRADETAMILIDGKGGQAALMQALQDEGVVRRGLVRACSFEDFISAHSVMDEAIKSGTVTHGKLPELDDQVKRSVRVTFSKRSGAWGWVADDGSPVPLVSAVALAHFATKTVKADPAESRQGSAQRRANNARGRRQG